MASTGSSLATLEIPASAKPVPLRATHVRWRILLLLMATAGMCHFNRISISVAGAEYIIPERGVNATQMGMVYSSYLFVYTLCMMPGGWLIDRWGPKRALLLLGFGSALLVPLTGLSIYAAAGQMLLVLCIVRGILGFVNAPMHPGAARAVSFWMPMPARGLANGLITGSAVIGISSTYFVFGMLMDAVGLPMAFAIAGSVTLGLTLVWLLYGTDRPSEHAGVNAAERELIEQRAFTAEVIAEQPEFPAPKVESSASDPGAQNPYAAPRSDTRVLLTGRQHFGALLTNRNLILLTLSYAAYSYFQYLFFYWMQYYFDEVLALSTSESRLYATIPTLTMAAGMVAGGSLTDYCQLLFGLRRGRIIVPLIGMMASGIFLALGLIGNQPIWVVVTCFSLAMGTLGLSEAPFWVTGIELGGRRGGLSGAILNTGGNVGGIISPYLTPLLSSFFGWKAGLAVASVLCLIGAGLWAWIVPGEPEES